MASGIFDRDSVKAIPVLGILYLLLKAYVIADYSLTTAGALVVAAPLTVLVGTITAYLNLALLLTAIGAAAWLFRHRTAESENGHNGDTRTFDAIAFGLCVACILFLPWPYSIEYFQEALLSAILYVFGTGMLALLAWYLVVRVRRRPRAKWLEWLLKPRHVAAVFLKPRHVAAVFVVSLLEWLLKPRYVAAVFVVSLLLPTLDKPWVPAEVLVLRKSIAIQDSHLDNNGELQRSKYPVAFVLTQDSTWTTVLDVETRILMRLPTETVAHRQVCRYKDQPPGSVPVWAFLQGFRYDSPNTMCDTLVSEHETLLDPLVTPVASDPVTPAMIGVAPSGLGKPYEVLPNALAAITPRVLWKGPAITSQSSPYAPTSPSLHQLLRGRVACPRDGYGFVFGDWGRLTASTVRRVTLIAGARNAARCAGGQVRDGDVATEYVEVHQYD